MGRLPLLADGSIVGDYEPLFRYWEKAKVKDRRLAENVTLKSEDFKYLNSLIEHARRINLLDLMETLTNHFIDRVEGTIAVETYKELLGLELEVSEAKRRIARILAGWLIEAGRQWGIVKLEGLYYLKRNRDKM
ncbi:MAG TPA: hypothetical protein EYH40_01500 [Desulfurococcales archaeon]|nr:hypothetical protein [Desulfurococcales archaeon]